MPLIQVRDVPEHIYRVLVERAKRERRSLAQQVVAVLALGLNVEVDAKGRRRNLITSIRQKNAGVGLRLSNPVELIREDRDR